MSTVTLYTLPDCQQCRATKRKMDQLGINYEAIDLSEDHDAREYVLSLGYSAAPVVDAGGMTWQGYKPEWIQDLVPAQAA